MVERRDSRAVCLRLFCVAAVRAALWRGAAAPSALRGSLAGRQAWPITQRLRDWEKGCGESEVFLSLCLVFLDLL